MSAACPIFGFDVTLGPTAGLDETMLAALRADFLVMAIDHHGLTAEASAAHRWRYTVRRDGGQATDADRDTIAGWAAAHPAIASCEIGPLVDLSPSA